MVGLVIFAWTKSLCEEQRMSLDWIEKLDWWVALIE